MTVLDRVPVTGDAGRVTGEPAGSRPDPEVPEAAPADVHLRVYQALTRNLQWKDRLVGGRDRIIGLMRLTADLINYWLRRKSPFVTQHELVCLLKKDRSDIDKQLHFEDAVHHQSGGRRFPGSPRMIAGWKDFALWNDKAVLYLEKPRSASELERLVRDWQSRRKDLAMTGWDWNRRADVIPTGDE